jgi:hypothetical protein
VQIFDHFFSANAATGLADKAPSFEKLADFFKPLGFEPDIDDIRIEILAIAKDQKIIGRIRNPLPQSEPGRVKYFFAGSPHHHRIRLPFDTDQ